MELVQNEKLQLACFRLAGRLFGVNIKDVKEVSSEILIAPIPHSKQSVKGYLNIRGQVFLVIDLHLEFGFDQEEITNSSKVIIFKRTVDEPFGILVDKIEDVIEVNSNLITDRRNNEKNIGQELLQRRQARKGIVQGVCPLQDELLLVLEANQILFNTK